jgi:hypothetical protein
VRKIIHCDCDCFYAAIEMRDDPRLVGKPLAVGGRPERRGVVATCNYEARKFGIHSAMPMAQAVKRCPDLLIVPPSMEKYRQVARQIFAIYHSYTPLVEPLSLDEAYLDVTDSPMLAGSGTRIAEDIRRRQQPRHIMPIAKPLQPSAKGRGGAGEMRFHILAMIGSEAFAHHPKPRIPGRCFHGAQQFRIALVAHQARYRDDHAIIFGRAQFGAQSAARFGIGMELRWVSPIQDGGGVWVNAKPARISGFFFADGQINIRDASGSAFKL